MMSPEIIERLADSANTKPDPRNLGEWTVPIRPSDLCALMEDVQELYNEYTNTRWLLMKLLNEKLSKDVPQKDKPSGQLSFDLTS